MGLTLKQQAFVDEYLVDRNGKQAAIRAGYSEKSAEVQASRLLSNAKVAEAVANAVEKRARKTGIDAEWVLKESESLYRECRTEGDRAQANKCLDTIGKHVDVQAFKDRVEHSGKIDLTGKTDEELKAIINGTG